ncbi:hypothetical protein KJ628_02765 [Patescibacteria group bacterium]|nr:hypothetical protein [Patescibacteria group bacterium]
MKKIINILLLAIVLFVFLNSKVQAGTDFFNSLENLKIGQYISENIKAAGQVIDKGNPNEINYLLDSSKFSQPHLVKTDLNDKLIYLELKIPENKIEYYKQYYKSLGKPESYLKKVSSQALVSYPSNGIGFVVNEQSENDLKIVKFPATPIDTFEKANEEKYKPVPETYSVTGYTKPTSEIKYLDKSQKNGGDISLVSDEASPIADEKNIASDEANLVSSDTSANPNELNNTLKKKALVNKILIIIMTILLLGLTFFGIKFIFNRKKLNKASSSTLKTPIVSPTSASTKNHSTHLAPSTPSTFQVSQHSSAIPITSPPPIQSSSVSKPKVPPTLV